MITKLARRACGGVLAPALLVALALGSIDTRAQEARPRPQGPRAVESEPPRPAPQQSETAPAPLALKPGPQAVEVRVQRWRIPTNDGSGTLMAATLARPPGEEPRPLVVINHGTPFRAEVPKLVEPYFRFAVEWFVERGFVVVMPLRRGHGVTAGPQVEFDGCRNPNYVTSGLEAARDIQATIDYMRTQPFVRRDLVLVVGISTGGWSSLGLASLNPSDVKAIVNFAGGRGGFVNRVPRATCDSAALIRAAGRFGASARIPTLWIYAENDNYFGPDLARAMHEAYTKAGGPAELHVLPPFADDGHVLFGHRDGPRIWAPLVEDFLKRTKALPAN